MWQLAGVRENDVIIGIGDEDVKWSSHEQVVSLIKAAKNVLSLRLIQPIEKPVHSKVKQVHGSFAYVGVQKRSGKKREKRERVEGPPSSRFELPATSSASHTATHTHTHTHKKVSVYPKLNHFSRNSIKFHGGKRSRCGGKKKLFKNAAFDGRTSMIGR